MPITEASVVYMEKHNKNDATKTTTTAATSSAKNDDDCFVVPQPPPPRSQRSPVFPLPDDRKHIPSPLYKMAGQKWDKVLNFDKILKQIKGAERYYIRGKTDHHHHQQQQQNSNVKGNSSKTKTPTQPKYRKRIQPQVQRLNAHDMHFYGIVPKKPFDVVVCDICLGIYTKMGFNNHMRLHHHQAWNSISSKSAHSKDGHNYQQFNNRQNYASGNPLAESSARAIPTASSSASNSRHKSSKSGSSGGGGGSSRSRSKSNKHHHHHHNTQHGTAAATTTTSAASSGGSITSSSTSQKATSSAELPPPQPSTYHTKSSKKGSSSLNNNISNSSSEIKTKSSELMPPPPPPVATTSSSSNSSNSLLASKVINLEINGLNDAALTPPVSVGGKEKSKSSKRKSKNSSSAAQSTTTLAPIDNNESSSIEFANPTINPTPAPPPSSKSSKRSSKAKGGKDLKIIEPQLSELDQAVSSITGGAQIEAVNTNSNDNDDVVVVSNATLNSTPTVTNKLNSIGFNASLAGGASLSQQQQQPQQQFPASTLNSMPILQEDNSNSQPLPSTQSQLQQQNSNDNDSSMLTLDDMLDSKFIHDILNTDESEIHFDESELDKATSTVVQQQQQQQTYLQPTASKRMRYDDNIDNDEQQNAGLGGKFAAFQHHQQQQQQQTHEQTSQQSSFHVTNLEDIKMYTTALDGQQYLTTATAAATSQPNHHQQTSTDQHQITTIDTIQLQQLLYQQQQQQQQGFTMDQEMSLDQQHQQQQQHYNNNSDVIMCSAEQLHKEGKINAADYATLTALSNNNSYNNVNNNNMCDVNALAAVAQFQVYNVPSLTDDDTNENDVGLEQKLNDIIVPQNHYVLPAGDGHDEEQLIYEITANNQVAIISQQRQQEMIAEFLTQAGYDNVDMNGNGATEPMDTKPMINGVANTTSTTNDPTNELLDFDFSRIETVTSVSSSSSSEHKIKTEQPRNDKYISTSTLPDDMFLNVFLYAGSPRPLALNTFGLVKLPQSVGTTFRKNLHATRKANNALQFSLSGNGSGSPAVTTRFGSPNISNVKSASTQNYFGNTNATTSVGNQNEFGSITIANQTINNNTTISNNSTQQQQQQTDKEFQFNSTNNTNGLITTASAISPSTNSNCSSSSRSSSRPKSASGGSGNNNSHGKNKQSNHSSSSSSTNVAATFQLPPQSLPKTIYVNTNLSSLSSSLSSASSSNTDKFIKRSFISKINPPSTVRNHISSKQLSDILLHPSKDNKEKLLLLTSSSSSLRDQDVKTENNTTGAGTVDQQTQQQQLQLQQQQQQQQRLKNVRNFYERRKKLMNASANAASTIQGGYNLARQLNSAHHQLISSSNSSSTALKQRLLRQRLLRTLSDCGINSIKSNNNSPNSGSNDILRVLA